jgi:hypothetical protein
MKTDIIAPPQYLFAFQDFDNGAAFEAMEQALAPLGFVDQSWHNNACPSLTLDRPDGERILEVFIDYKSRDLRENPKIITTYCVNHYDDEGEYEGCAEFVQHKECLAYIKAAYMKAKA